MAYATKEKRNAAARKWRAANPEKHRASSRKWAQRNPERVRENNRKWVKANPERRRASNRKWARANPEAVTKWAKQHPEKHREHSRKWREKNPDRDRTRDREYGSAWQRANPELTRMYKTKRRALKAGATVENVNSRIVFERDNYICLLCGEPTSGSWPAPTSPSVDHIVPLSKGGAHSYANTQCAHLGCNRSKGARTPETVISEAA